MTNLQLTKKIQNLEKQIVELKQYLLPYTSSKKSKTTNASWNKAQGLLSKKSKALKQHIKRVNQEWD
jgi:hypothetical protein